MSNPAQHLSGRNCDRLAAPAEPRGNAPSPTVTVALACFDQARFLGDALASILAQSRPADAIIVVDDGSRDATPEVAARFAGVRYYRQANAGLSAARNAGLRLATSSHILFLDADDRLRPTALAAAVDRIAGLPAAALVYGGYRDVAADLTPLRERSPVTFADAYRALLHDNFIGMHGTVLYDAARLRSIGGFDVSLKSCEDWDVYLKLARAHPIAAYPAIAAEYRRHAAGMSTDAPRMLAMTRVVLNRQRALGLTAPQLQAARAGLAFTRRQLSLRLLEELRAEPARAPAIMRTGLAVDPLFPFRLLGAIARRLTVRLRPPRSSR